MATLRIPIDATRLNYTQVVELNGVNYSMNFRWNDRAAAWFLTLSDAAGNVLVGGQKLTVDWIQFQTNLDPRLPLGRLALVDTTQAGIEATADNFGTDVVLLYVEG